MKKLGLFTSLWYWTCLFVWEIKSNKNTLFAMTSLATPEVLRNLFATADKDKSGGISRAELSKLLEKLGFRFTVRRVTRIVLRRFFVQFSRGNTSWVRLIGD